MPRSVILNIPNRIARLVLFLAILLSLPPSPRPAFAEDSLEASILKGFEQTIGATDYVARFELVGTPRSRLMLLSRPDRVALDLFDTVSALAEPKIVDNALVGDMRQGLVASDRYRLVMTLKQPGIPRADLETRDGHTFLTLTITQSDEKAFREAMKTAKGVGQAEQPGGPTPPAVPERKFTIVVDPGHGGVDNGAHGIGGTFEKDVNLQFGLALRDALKMDDHVTVILTREDDRFIPLSERSEIGRRAKADLFVSLHADSIRFGDMRGATVYTLSEKASDSLALEIADSENASDRYAGPLGQQSEPEVHDILVELMRRETESFSEHFAAGLVEEFASHDIRLIKNPKRSAGFRVLKAPDMPSVLIEMGYLSNASDEALLRDEVWRGNLAKAIASAVLRFLDSRDGVETSRGG